MTPFSGLHAIVTVLPAEYDGRGVSRHVWSLEYTKLALMTRGQGKHGANFWLSPNLSALMCPRMQGECSHVEVVVGLFLLRTMEGRIMVAQAEPKMEGSHFKMPLARETDLVPCLHELT